MSIFFFLKMIQQKCFQATFRAQLPHLHGGLLFGLAPLMAISKTMMKNKIFALKVKAQLLMWIILANFNPPTLSPGILFPLSFSLLGVLREDTLFVSPRANPRQKASISVMGEQRLMPQQAHKDAHFTSVNRHCVARPTYICSQLVKGRPKHWPSGLLYKK